jgi:hypothetical protein
MKTGAQIDHHGLVIGPELRPSSGYDICDLSLEASLEELRLRIAHLQDFIVFVRFVSGEASKGSLS